MKNAFYLNYVLNPQGSSNFLTKVRTYSTVKKRWESVIGLEVHAQIAANCKLFSGTPASYGSPVNTQVSFFDAGHPGTLPVLNKRCVEASVLTSLALGCQVNKKSVFDRKHYFYADLPVGYQITQQRLPLAVNGKLKFVVHNPLKINLKPYTIEARIKQLQLEQDSGKSMHDDVASCSLIDLNRAGMPLMEIVFEPDLKSSDEAASLINELKLILLKLGVCSCKMEEGALRVDVNVSVNQPGKPFGVRTEIKNLNSVRSVANAVDCEIERQIKLLEVGKVIENQTRMFDPQLKKTVSMRDKEKVQDYRFMPEPNLPPLIIYDNNDSPEQQKDHINIDVIRNMLPQLPEQTRQQLVNSYKLSYEVASQLVHEDVLLNGFYALTKADIPLKRILTFLLAQLTSALNLHKMEISQCKITHDAMVQLLLLEKNGRITIATFLKLIDMMICGETRSPNDIVAENGWYQIEDEKIIENLCRDVMNENTELVSTNKKKDFVYNTLVTLARERSENRANMKIMCQIMKRLLNHK